MNFKRKNQIFKIILQIIKSTRKITITWYVLKLQIVNINDCTQ